MKKRQVVSLALAGAMALSVTACGGGQGTDTKAPAADSGKNEAAADSGKSDSGKPVPIRWLTTGDAAAKVIKEDDRIVAAINEKLGIDLKVEIVPENNTEKVNVAMASGDFPDVVTGAYGTSATQQWIDDGMVIPLTPYMDKLPNIKAWLDDYQWTAVNGDYYGIPFITQYQAANTLLMMRKDWLDKLGLSYPKTLDEMKTVLTAFTNDDPDGNGKNDTYGFSSEKPSSTNGQTPFDWVFFAYGLPHGDYSLDADDQVIPIFEDPSFIPAMHYIKDLWDSGVVDPELMLNDIPKKEEKFYQGKIGAMPATVYRHINRHENSLKELFPDGELCYDMPPAGPDGALGMSRQGKNGFLTCVTTACKNQDKAAEFVDFMISEEGNHLLRYGIEGIHYTKEGDKIVYNMEERAKDAFSDNGWAHALAWGSFYWPLESGFMPDTEVGKERALASVEVASKCQVPNLVKQKTPAEVQDGSAVNDIFIQYFSDMLQGKIGIEEGTAKLSEAWRSQGGEEILKEANDVYHATK
ncbi:MAG: extracellular solute-binding protein [Lachnospiraceae bacterium]|nr:extracellular solute-binding protein [Lachnospiraceae bacterium]